MNLKTHIIYLVTHFRWADLLDIIFVWAIIYRILMLIRKTGTIQMLSGLGVLAMAYIASIGLGLMTFNWILEKFFSNLFVIVVILFQAEIRRALAQIGSNPFFTDVMTGVQETQVMEELVKAAFLLADKGIGALIVLEREILIDYHVETGTEMDAAVSSELILSIFQTTSPIHDGAMLIRGGKIHSAGNFLPLSKKPDLDKNFGTRHRAALGLSEETDALVVLVSEEQKTVSFIQSGSLRPMQDSNQLRKVLYDSYGLKYKGAV